MKPDRSIHPEFVDSRRADVEQPGGREGSAEGGCNGRAGELPEAPRRAPLSREPDRLDLTEVSYFE